MIYKNQITFKNVTQCGCEEHVFVTHTHGISAVKMLKTKTFFKGKMSTACLKSSKIDTLSKKCVFKYKY